MRGSTLTQLLLVHHGAEVPEEGPGAKLTVVGLHPFRNFFSHCIHFPKNHDRVLTAAYELLSLIGVRQSRNLVAGKAKV